MCVNGSTGAILSYHCRRYLFRLLQGQDTSAVCHGNVTTASSQLLFLHTKASHHSLSFLNNPSTFNTFRSASKLDLWSFKSWIVTALHQKRRSCSNSSLLQVGQDSLLRAHRRVALASSCFCFCFCCLLPLLLKDCRTSTNWLSSFLIDIVFLHALERL